MINHILIKGDVPLHQKVIEKNILATEIQGGMMSIEEGIIDIGDLDQDHLPIEATPLMNMILAQNIEIIKEGILEKGLTQEKQRKKNRNKILK